jgi:hypothetical protein
VSSSSSVARALPFPDEELEIAVREGGNLAVPAESVHREASGSPVVRLLGEAFGWRHFTQVLVKERLECDLVTRGGLAAAEGQGQLIRLDLRGLSIPVTQGDRFSVSLVPVLEVQRPRFRVLIRAHPIPAFLPRAVAPPRQIAFGHVSPPWQRS